MNTADHQILLIRNMNENSTVLSTKNLHMTKSAAHIRKALSPVPFKNLIKDVENTYLSLITDESTAIDATKMLTL